MTSQFSGNSFGENDPRDRSDFDQSGASNAWGLPDEGGPSGYGTYDALPGQGEISESDDKTFATIAALSGPAGLLLSVGWLGFVGPLVVWFIYRDRSPFLREQAARAFNFQLGVTLLSIVGWILFFTLIFIPVSVILWIVSVVLSVYHPVLAALAYSRGEPYRYPLSFPIIH